MNRREREAAEEVAIMEMMDEMERDACAIFTPDIEIVSLVRIDRSTGLYSPFGIPARHYGHHAGRRPRSKHRETVARRQRQKKERVPCPTN